MKHMTQEELISHLYEENDATQRNEAQAHLQGCSECQARFVSLRATTAALNTWELPPMKPARAWQQPALKWAIAAAAVMAVGISLGRATSPRSISMDQAKAELRKELQGEIIAAMTRPESTLQTSFQKEFRAGMTLWADASIQNANLGTQKLLEDYALTLGVKREEDRQSIVDYVAKLDTQYKVEFTKLRRDLETVAVVAQDQFQQTRQDIGTLASYRAPDPQ